MKKLTVSFFVFAIVAAFHFGTLNEASAAETRQNFIGDFPAPPAPVALRPDRSGEGDDPTIVTGPNGTPALRITYDGQGGQNNGVALNQLYSGGYDTMQLDFQIRVDGIGDNADGFGWAYANTDLFGTTTSSPNPVWSLPEEPNLNGSLGLGFDTYHNDGLDVQPGVNGPSPNSASLHFNGAVLSQFDFSTAGDDLFFESGNLINVQVLAEAASAPMTGTNVTVKLSDSVLNSSYTPFTNVNIPDMQPYDGRMAFRGRTGGADSNQEVENISLSFTPVGGGAVQTFTEDFNSFDIGEIPGGATAPVPMIIGGTPFTTFQSGLNPPAQLNSDTSAGGIKDGHLRIAHEVVANTNIVAFDKTSELNTANIEASFSFRIQDNGQLGRADGFSFMLIPTDLFGDTGTDMLPDLNPAEEANVEFGLGIGFDTYVEGDEAPVEPNNIGNHISLHWNNGIVGGSLTDCGNIPGCVNLDRANEMDLVNGAWNQAKLSVQETAAGAAVTLTITDGTDGSVHVVFDQLNVAGVEFPFGSRLALAARTGGQADNFDIDNILVTWGDEVATLVCDADGDGDCQADDLAIMYTQRGTAGSMDLDGNGTVDGNDVDDWLLAASGADNPGKANPSHTYLMGDVDLNGSVTSADLGKLLNNFGSSNGVGYAGGDLNMDLAVGSADLGLLLNNFGHISAASAAVPEPGSLAMLLVGCIALIRRRR